MKIKYYYVKVLQWMLYLLFFKYNNYFLDIGLTLNYDYVCINWNEIDYEKYITIKLKQTNKPIKAYI